MVKLISIKRNNFSFTNKKSLVVLTSDELEYGVGWLWGGGALGKVASLTLPLSCFICLTASTIGY